VPADWQHPKDESGAYIPLHDGKFAPRDAERREDDGFMPSWTDEQVTHLMMYECTSEGTPISPACKTAEELARWLADNNASAFGEATATYDQWLVVCRLGWAPSCITSDQGVVSGVEYLGNQKPKP